jgi:cell division septation protein DedD
MPLMIGPEPERGKWRVWVLFGLFAIVAAGAVAYFTLDSFRQFIGLAGDQPPTTGIANVSAKDVRPPDSTASSPSTSATSGATNAGASPGKQDAPANGQQAKTPSHEIQPAPPVETTPAATGQPMVSLQAASFPNQAAATAFSERLAKAGVPAYVVAADIPKRGRWYRVRAGKFATAEEARRYAAEWRQRARAAGIGIDLVTCNYDQP